MSGKKREEKDKKAILEGWNNNNRKIKITNYDEILKEGGKCGKTEERKCSKQIAEKQKGGKYNLLG